MNFSFPLDYFYSLFCSVFMPSYRYTRSTVGRGRSARRNPPRVEPATGNDEPDFQREYDLRPRPDFPPYMRDSMDYAYNEDMDPDYLPQGDVDVDNLPASGVTLRERNNGRAMFAESPNPDAHPATSGE